VKENAQTDRLRAVLNKAHQEKAEPDRLRPLLARTSAASLILDATKGELRWHGMNELGVDGEGRDEDELHVAWSVCRRAGDGWWSVMLQFNLSLLRRASSPASVWVVEHHYLTVRFFDLFFVRRFSARNHQMQSHGTKSGGDVDGGGRGGPTDGK